jgi:hypothetical protein
LTCPLLTVKLCSGYCPSSDHFPSYEGAFPEYLHTTLLHPGPFHRGCAEAAGHMLGMKAGLSGKASGAVHVNQEPLTAWSSSAWGLPLCGTQTSYNQLLSHPHYCGTCLQLAPLFLLAFFRILETWCLWGKSTRSFFFSNNSPPQGVMMTVNFIVLPGPGRIPRCESLLLSGDMPEFHCSD